MDIYFRFRAWFVILFFCLALISIGVSCQALIPSFEPSTIETQTALNVQATMIAKQSAQDTQPTIKAQAATLSIQTELLTQQVGQINIQSAQLTQSAPSAKIGSDLVTQQPNGTQLASPAPLPSLTPTRALDMNSILKSSKILLYENMAGVFNTTRYVKQALDELGAKYVDVADKQGSFKQQLVPEKGKQNDWDLIISADEERTSRSSIKGEFFSYFQQYIEKGTSVIVETWNVDTMMDAPLLSLLTQCGVEFQGDLYDLRYQSQVFYALKHDHPVLNTPNHIEMAYIADYWPLQGDLGDLFQRKTEDSPASILLGRKPDRPNQYGTLVECMDGRLIIQSFSTHQYKQSNIIALWQNYIYNGLRSHYLYSGP